MKAMIRKLLLGMGFTLVKCKQIRLDLAHNADGVPYYNFELSIIRSRFATDEDENAFTAEMILSLSNKYKAKTGNRLKLDGPVEVHNGWRNDE